MKKIYIKPVCEDVKLIFEAELCAFSTTTTSGDLEGDHFPGGSNQVDTGDGPDVMHSKGGDFFEETISPSSGSIWGDDED